MKNTKPLIGDIFEVSLEYRSRKYFQYLNNDENQLQSDVIRVFSFKCEDNESVDLVDIIESPIDFYAHCVIKAGIKQGLWKLIGNIEPPSELDIFFRSTKDFGRDHILVSKRWRVWKVNQKPVEVGKLPDEFATAEPGSVYPPYEIIHRMKHGKYEQFIQS